MGFPNELRTVWSSILVAIALTVLIGSDQLSAQAPLPPERPIVSLPGPFGSPAGCADDGEENTLTILHNDRIVYYEALCTFENVEALWKHGWEVEASCSGEGNTWNLRYTFVFDPGTNTVSVAELRDDGYRGVGYTLDSCSLPQAMIERRDALRRAQ